MGTVTVVLPVTEMFAVYVPFWNANCGNGESGNKLSPVLIILSRIVMLTDAFPDPLNVALLLNNTHGWSAVNVHAPLAVMEICWAWSVPSSPTPSPIAGLKPHSCEMYASDVGLADSGGVAA